MEDKDPLPALVMSLVPSRADAARAVDALDARGVPLADVSVAFRFSRADATTRFDGFIPPDDASGPIGSLPAGLRALSGWGALVLPEMGPLLAAGPVLAAIAEIAICPWGGGVSRALGALGIDAAAARTCVEGIGEGAVLVLVRARDEDTLAAAHAVLSTRDSGVRALGSQAAFEAA